jgi:hypothetical protein
MSKPSNSIDAVLEAMPFVRAAVRKEIANRIEDGDDIGHVRDGNLMINDRVVTDIDSVTGISPEKTKRRAA